MDTSAGGIVPSFQFYSPVTTGSGLSINRRGADGSAPYTILQKTRADAASAIGTHAAVTLNDGLGAYVFAGDDGTNFVNGASINAFVDGTVSTGVMPSRLVFSTVRTGNTFQSEALRINSSGFVGVNTASPVATLHVSGASVLTGVVYFQSTLATKTTTSAITAAELLTGVIQYTGGTGTLTLPTGTDIDAAVPANLPTNLAFDVSVINTGTGVVTIAVNTGVTSVGGLTVAVGASGRFRFRKVGVNTYIVYRIS